MRSIHLIKAHFVQNYLTWLISWDFILSVLLDVEITIQRIFILVFLLWIIMEKVCLQVNMMNLRTLMQLPE
mgnify:CR=1 FL=1